MPPPLTRWAVLAALTPAAVFVCINLGVMLLGGQVHPVQLRGFEARARALGVLALHLPGHFEGGCSERRRDQLRQAAARHGLPPDFVEAVAHVESRLRPHRVSAAGAMGVMQLMPGTAAELGVTDPFDAAENIDAGVRYLARLWRRYRGDRQRVAAAYNAGPGAVPTQGPLPRIAETRGYVRDVVRRSPEGLPGVATERRSTEVESAQRGARRVDNSAAGAARGLRRMPE